MAAVCTVVGAACAPAGPSAPPQIIVLGVDGMDPAFARAHLTELPHLSELAFADLGTTIPPQSPVAWSTVITGQDPGGHGIFDFIHRHPDTVKPFSSMSETTESTHNLNVGKYVIPLRGGTTRSLRHGPVFWDGIEPAVITRMPTNFPPADTGARSISGMGTPDMLGTFGTFTFYTSDQGEQRKKVRGGRIVKVTRDSKHRFETKLRGPVNTRLEQRPRTTVPVVIDLDPERDAAVIDVGGTRVVLRAGEWSDWVAVEFPLLDMVESTHGIVRLFLDEVRPHLRLYVSPVNVDPLEAALPISEPSGYSAELASAVGRFYTQGMPSDTKALSAGVLGLDDFVAQNRLVLEEEIALFAHQLGELDGGFFFSYFSAVDQGSHMLWHRHPERVLELYKRIDDVVGMTLDATGDDTVVIVISDHGFARYDRKVHLNRWLLEQGYLALLNPTLGGNRPGFANVDWSRTKAYALGMNGLYLNLRGRETQGIVDPADAPALRDEIRERLLALQDGESTVVEKVYEPRAIFEGTQLDYAPDLIVGYARGFRQSNHTALGRVPPRVFEDNKSAWIGDHCIAANQVPGVLFSTRRLTTGPHRLHDIPVTILEHLGRPVGTHMVGRSVLDDGVHQAQQRAIQAN